MGAPRVDDRRARTAQRSVVDDLLPEDAGVLRTVDGEVVIYEELATGNRTAAEVRARVLPDGELLIPERRFRRR